MKATLPLTSLAGSKPLQETAPQSPQTIRKTACDSSHSKTDAADGSGTIKPAAERLLEAYQYIALSR